MHAPEAEVVVAAGVAGAVVVGFDTRVVVATAVVGAAGSVARDGLAEQVLTLRPARREVSPSAAKGSEAPGATVPTKALKL